MGDRPLLLIDVDGVLNPDASNNTMNKHNRRNEDQRFTLHRLAGFRVWLSPWHGEQLLALADRFELTWCTTWEHNANEWIGPHLGLPKLPVIEFDKTWALPSRGDGTYFKTHEAVAYARGRPFAWVDDEISVYDEQYVADVHPAPAKLLRINPAAGLRQPDFDTLASWAASLEEVTTTDTGGP